MADGDVVLAAVGPAGGGAVLLLRVDAATGELLAARLLNPLAEHAGRHARIDARAALLAADPEHVHRAPFVDAGEPVPRRGLRLGDHLPVALLPLAAAAAPRRGLIPHHRFAGALLFDTGVEAPADDRLRGALLFNTGVGAPRRYLIADELRGALLDRDDLRGALLGRDDLLLVASLSTRGAYQVAVGFAPSSVTNGPGDHHGRGLLPAPTLFRGGLVTEPSGTAALLPTPEAEERVVVRVFAADNDRTHGPQIAATEDQGLGRPLLDALVVSIGAHGNHNAPGLIFEMETLCCGRSTATDRGRHDDLLADSVVVRVFVAADDGSNGPFISATRDKYFGRSLLAALAVSSGVQGNRTSAQVVFEVEVLRRDPSIAAAGDLRFEHVSGRALLITSPRNAHSPGDSLASSKATPLNAAVAAPLPSSVARGGTTSFVPKIRKSVGKKTWIQKGRMEKICSKRLVKFRSLLGDFVWFAVPSVLLFFPKKVEGNDQANGSEQSKPYLTLLGMMNPENPSTEKSVVMLLFVIFLSIWIMAYILASLGRGKSCVKVVGMLTYMTLISVIAFIDYMLSKTMPQDILYKVLFGVHFIIMASCITQVWRVFVMETPWQLPSLPKLQDMVNRMKTWYRQPSRLQENNNQGASSLNKPLLVQGHEMV